MLPPPFTIAQIGAMTSLSEKTNARAALTSYIANAKKEIEEKKASEATQSTGNSDPGYPGPGYSGPAYPNPGFPSAGHTSSYRIGPKRGGHYTSYHPYLRPQTFANRSVVSGGADHTTEFQEANETDGPSHGSDDATGPATSGQHIKPKAQVLCFAFTSTGVCSRHWCRYLHDPDQVAICKRYLYKDCKLGERCALSHESSSHNTPTCIHFQAGGCTNDDCHFAHVRVNPGALNCDAFGRLGYCEKGDTCSELHAFECPTFTNTGACRYGDHCRLGHVQRANRMRKATRLSSATHSGSSATPDGSGAESGAGSDNGSGAGPDTPEDEAVPAQDSHEWIMPQKSDKTPHQFTQQADYVSLNSIE